jgi:hypothetical protein
LIAVTFFVGFGALWTSNRINERQTERIATVENELVSAKLALAQQQERAAKADERAAKARHDLLQLQIKLAPRRISDDLRPKLVESLRKPSPKGKIDIEAIANDSEGAAFAFQLWEILGEAGWPRTPVNGGVHPVPPTGFGVIVHSRAKMPPHAASLHAAFHAVGEDIGEIVEAPHMVPEGVVRLMIGRKRE